MAGTDRAETIVTTPRGAADARRKDRPERAGKADMTDDDERLPRDGGQGGKGRGMRGPDERGGTEPGRARAVRRLRDAEGGDAEPGQQADDLQSRAEAVRRRKAEQAARGGPEALAGRPRNPAAALARRQAGVPARVEEAGLPAPADESRVPAPRPQAKPPAPPAPPLPPSGAGAIGAAGVRPSRPLRQRRFLLVSFLVCVLLPSALMAYYLWDRAQDRYLSTSAFFIHRQDTTPSIESVFGFTGIGATSTTPDADVLYQFIQSQQMVELAHEKLDLHRIFSGPHDIDPVFALDPDATLEEMVDYWGRMVKLVFAPENGLLTVEVDAFDPKDAQALNQLILDESGNLIDRLSQVARDDTIADAKTDLDQAEEKLKAARVAMAAFRSESNFVDPGAQVAGSEGVISALEQRLAEEMLARDTLESTTTRADDPRLERADRNIASIRERIEAERAKVGTNQVGVVSQFEALAVDRQFAEHAYTAALGAYDAAVAEARRKSRYLAVHITPTLANTAVYPQRLILTLVGSAFLLMAWAILMLVIYSIHDRR